MTTPQTEHFFTPLVSAYRRKLDRMHFMPASGETVTFCGLRTTFLDSGCLSQDMDFKQVQEQVDVCKRCFAHIRKAVQS